MNKITKTKKHKKNHRNKNTQNFAETRSLKISLKPDYSKFRTTKQLKISQKKNSKISLKKFFSPLQTLKISLHILTIRGLFDPDLHLSYRRGSILN